MEMLRFERFLKRVSQEKLASLTGLTQSTVSRIERGLRKPKPRELAAIARALNVEPQYLWPAQEGGR